MERKQRSDFNKPCPPRIDPIQLLDKPVIDVAVVSPSWLRQGEIMARYQREIAIQEAIRQLDVIIAHDEILKVVQVNLLEKLVQQEEFW